MKDDPRSINIILKRSINENDNEINLKRNFISIIDQFCTPFHEYTIGTPHINL